VRTGGTQAESILLKTHKNLSPPPHQEGQKEDRVQKSGMGGGIFNPVNLNLIGEEENRNETESPQHENASDNGWRESSAPSMRTKGQGRNV